MDPCAAIRLISVHVPKCAGTSLKTAISTAFGPEAFHGDYGDRPIDPRSNFDLVGFYERLPDDYVKLEKLLGMKLQVGVERGNGFPNYDQRRGEMLADTALLGRLRNLLRDDIDLYENLL